MQSHLYFIVVLQIHITNVKYTGGMLTMKKIHQTKT
jgi:hypothetical protein